MVDQLGSGYLGSKAGAGVYQKIVAAMPPHDTYIETHLGAAAILLAKPPALRSIGLDVDPDVIAAAARRLAGLDPAPELHCIDAVAFLDGFDFAAAGRTLVYMDPPYVLATRSSRHRYAHDYSDADHARLIECARALPCPVMISGYPSALYDRLLGDWRRLEFRAMTRGGVRTECLWCSFPAGDVHWHTYAGRNYVDRQRIKRLAERWGRNFHRRPAAERVAILAALLRDPEA